MSRPRIVIIDDDADVRDGLETFLSQDFDVCSFPSAIAFWGARKTLAPPDCILLDLKMPEMDGISLQVALKSAGYAAPIIFMSGDAEKADIIAAWREGASSFVLKPFSAKEIRNSIDRLLSRDSETSEAVDLPITRREAQVLLLLGQGLHQHEVAGKLGLSLRSVKMYRSFLRHKLNLHSVIEIGRFYDRHKIAIANLAQADESMAGRNR